MGWTAAARGPLRAAAAGRTLPLPCVPAGPRAAKTLPLHCVSAGLRG